MEAQVKLPRELEEEILSRLPPQSLLRFRSVCKRWNALLDEKCFIKNHMSHSCPHFICMTDSKLCSINIIGLDSDHPTPELRELPFSDFPDMNINSALTFITAFDEFLFSTSWEDRRAVLWNPWLNPWLKQFELIKHNDILFYPYGLGYNNTLPEKVYKIFGCYVNCCEDEHIARAAIYEFTSNAFKFIDTAEKWSLWDPNHPIVPFNGNLYWVSSNPKTRDYFIQSFDFSEDIFKPFCHLPWNQNESRDELVLAVFKGDRFSLLKCDHYNIISKIEIWVMETKKIDSDNGEEVVWINLMTLSENLPFCSYDKKYGISYFIYDKTLIMCCVTNQTTNVPFKARVYILREDMMKTYNLIHTCFRRLHCFHSVYAPNFTPVPMRLQVE